MAYVALQRMRFGEVHLAPGDEVPDESGRNYNLMVRQGLIADLEEAAVSEEAHTRQVAGYKARITVLEGELEDAHTEIAALRAADSEEGEPDEPSPDETPAEGGADGGERELEDLSRDDLVALAAKEGLEVPNRAPKGVIIAALRAAADE